MNTYKVLVEISFAARKYNPGETVMMPESRAAKYLTKNQIKLAEQPEDQIELAELPEAKKEAKS